MSDRQEKITVNGSTGDQDSTFGNPCKNLAANENLVLVKTLKRCLNENTGCKIGNIVYTVEDKILNLFLTAIDGTFNQKLRISN